MVNVIIVGHTGFIGRNIFAYFCNKGYIVRGFSRHQSETYVGNKTTANKSENNLYYSREFEDALSLSDVLIYCAYAAHATESKDTLANLHYSHEYLEHICRLTLKTPIWRFLYISSISVFGEQNYNDTCLNSKIEPNPTNLYGFYKLRSELYIEGLNSPLFCCIRVPLVYGEEPPGNLALLRKLVLALGFDPFVSWPKRKTLLDVNTLAIALSIMMSRKIELPTQIFLAGIDDLTLSQIINKISTKSSRAIRSVYLPSIVFMMCQNLPFTGFTRKLLRQLTIEPSSNYLYTLKIERKTNV
jgi:nucleoside-diphosphate-sugar epimerase